MVPKDADDEKSLKIPVVNTERCIGCGACENLCPSRPFSAIYVEGHETVSYTHLDVYKRQVVGLPEGSGMESGTCVCHRFGRMGRLQCGKGGYAERCV